MGNRKPIVLIKSGDIKKHFTMNEAIDAMESAFASLSAGEVEVPQRYVTGITGEDLIMFMKPAYSKKDRRAGIKILTQKEGRTVEGLPTIIGIVLLIDAYTGEILSIMDGEHLTALRTGAAGGIAAKYLSREDSSVMALFGCGTQGRTQLEAVNCVRNIKKVWVFDKFKNSALNFVEQMKDKVEAEIAYTDDLEVLKECDIICTATNSNSPLFGREHIKEGAHINAIGAFKPEMQEIDPAVIKEARIFVDQLEPALNEAGDIIKAINAGAIAPGHIAGELGSCILGNIKGRTGSNNITLFKSVGVAIQDYEVANKIYEKALTANFGEGINLFE